MADAKLCQQDRVIYNILSNTTVSYTPEYSSEGVNKNVYLAFVLQNGTTTLDSRYITVPYNTIPHTVH